MARIENKNATLRVVSSADSQVHVATTDRERPDEGGGHHAFQVIWYVTNILLLAAILTAAYSSVWEYSTRMYLKGFSDAIIPAVGTPEEKIEAILHWMSDGPSRREYVPDGSIRDPAETLNYGSLLKVCGTATNAFLNLADSAGLRSRRLLLLGPDHRTTHVVAEVLIEGRWIVVDPAFRTILQDSAGRTLTRKDLSNHSVFMTATSGIPNYDPTYTYDRTVHVRMARLGSLGGYLRLVLNRIVPGWEDSATASLLLERESLATMVAATFLVMVLILIRTLLRWYGAHRLGILRPRITTRTLRAWNILFRSSKAT